MSSSTSYRAVRVRSMAAAVVCTALLFALATSHLPALAQPIPLETYQLSGRVYAGAVGVETTPLVGVTVTLYVSNNIEYVGTEAAHTTTGADGWYGLTLSTGWEFYNILETNPSGYVSVGATSVSGTVVTADRIRYSGTGSWQEKTLTGNKFWDQVPTTATSTATATSTTAPSATRTATLMSTPASSSTPTRTSAATVTPSRTATWSATPADTPSRTATSSLTPLNTSTVTKTPQQSPTNSPTPTRTQTPSLTPNYTSTVTKTPQGSPSNTRTATNTVQPSATGGPTLTRTATTSPQPTQVYNRTVCADMDTYVSDGDPDANYGGSPKLMASTSMGTGEPVLQRILLQFDLSWIPTNVEVVSADLQLLQTAGTGLGAALLTAYPIGQDWQETHVTWSNQPSVLNDPLSQVPSPLGGPVIVSWDVRALVQRWLARAIHNNGVEIRGPEQGGAWWREFDSGEEQILFCPRLVLMLGSSAPVPTLTNTPNPTATITPTSPCSVADEDSNTFAGAPALVTGTEGYICPSGDIDYWKFYAANNQRITLGIELPPGNPPGVPAPNYDACLLRPDGSLAYCSRNTNPAYGEGFIDAKADATGQWRLQIFGATASDWNSSQTYTINYYVCAQADEAGQDFDSAESIEASTSEVSNGTSYYGYICPEDDEDWYKFTVPSSYEVTVTITLKELGVDYDIDVYTPDETFVKWSHNGGTADEKVTTGSGAVGGEWRVRVFGSGVSSATQPYRLDVDLTGVVRDLAVDAWEVTQGIQNLSAYVSLVADKTTYVRVYGKQTKGGDADAVACRLIGKRDGVALSGSPLSALNGTQALSVGGTYDRADENDGWLFKLPASWITPGNTVLTAEVDPKKVYYETNLSNNSRTATFAFTDVPPSCHVYVPVRTNAPAASVFDTNFGAMVDLYKRLWPISDVWTYYLTDDIAELDGFTYAPYDIPEDSWKIVLALQNRDNWTDDPDECDDCGARTHYVGMVHPDTDTNDNGSTVLGYGSTKTAHCWVKLPDHGASSTAWTWPAAGVTLAHELGHNWGLSHVNCGGAPNPGFYPYPVCQIGYTGATEYYGFDVNTQVPIAPDTARDIMAYNGSQWVSAYTWGLLFDEIRLYSTVAEEAPKTTPDVPDLASAASAVLVSGVVTQTESTGHLEYAWVLPTGQLSADMLRKWQAVAVPASVWPAAADACHIRLLDGALGVLADQAVTLTPDVWEITGAAKTATFQVSFAAPAGTVAYVDLMLGDTVLARLSPGTHVPDVHIQSPAGGVIGGPLEVVFHALDADSADVLRYGVQYSPDSGSSWRVLTMDNPIVPGSDPITFTLTDASDLPGSTTGGRVRVVVSDGYHTGIAVSELFTVPNRPPRVVITAPAGPEMQPAEEPAVLSGNAMDAEDGGLSGDALTWRLNGQIIGTGQEQIVAGLKPGEYLVTLSAADAQAQVGEASAFLRIGPLSIPAGPRPVLDGYADEPAYGAAIRMQLAPYPDGSQATVLLQRSGSRLWLCFTGLQFSPARDDYVGVRVDGNGSQDGVAQDHDFGFFVREDGSVFTRRGNGAGGFSDDGPGGVLAVVVHRPGSWTAEMSIDLAVLENQTPWCGMLLAHEVPAKATAYQWPYASADMVPATWGTTRIEAGGTVVLPLIRR